MILPRTALCMWPLRGWELKSERLKSVVICSRLHPACQQSLMPCQPHQQKGLKSHQGTKFALPVGFSELDIKQVALMGSTFSEDGKLMAYSLGRCVS